MNSRDFYLKQLDLSIGDIVYYVIGSDAAYSIKKTRIIGVKARTQGRLFHDLKIEYTVYETEDGRLISRTSFVKKSDEMSAKQVFRTKDEAVQFIIDCLHKEINQEKHSLLNAQERLARAERVLKVYEKYGKTK
jgi:ubiquitin C-terminal hydrolase